MAKDAAAPAPSASGDGDGDDGDGALTARMRRATRAAHSASDAAVNLRLAGALADRERWGRAISIFYVVVSKFESLILESAARKGGEALLGGVADVLAAGAARAPGFEADLEYYLGKNWRERVEEEFTTPGVRSYVAHLEELARDDPVLLVPYAFHLHMGMLSGGQILRNTARRTMSLPRSGEGVEMFSLTYRGERGGAVSRLKREYRAVVDGLGSDLDEARTEAFVAASVECFRRNNVIVGELPWGARAWDLYRVLPDEYRGYARAAAAATAAVACAVGAAAVWKHRQ